MLKVIGLFLIVSQSLFSQNAILNGGFEGHSSCPNRYGEINKCSGWTNATIFPSDYFNNSCDSIGANSFKKHQERIHAKNGSGYVGMVLFLKDYFLSGGEFIQYKLDTNLEKDSIYHFSMYIKMDSSNVYYVNSLGVDFTEKQKRNFKLVNGYYTAKRSHGFDLILPKDIINGEWIRIEQSFKASGKEKWITIGAFRSRFSKREYKQIQKNNINKEGTSTVSYYYIDNIELVISKRSPVPSQQTH